MSDIGIYTIDIKVSDAEPKTLTSSFIVEILNTPPKVVQSPPNISMAHGKTLSIPLTGYFADDDGDLLIVVATYSLPGAPTQPIPGGIFT